MTRFLFEKSLNISEYIFKPAAKSQESLEERMQKANKAWLRDARIYRCKDVPWRTKCKNMVFRFRRRAGLGCWTETTTPFRCGELWAGHEAQNRMLVEAVYSVLCFACDRLSWSRKAMDKIKGWETKDELIAQGQREWQ